MSKDKFTIRFPREAEFQTEHPEIYDKVTELLEREGYYTSGYGEDTDGYYVCYGPKPSTAQDTINKAIVYLERTALELRELIGED